MNFNLLIVRNPVIFSNLAGADQGGDLRLAKERSSELWKQGAGVKARDRVRIGHLEKTKIDTKTIASLQVYKFIQIPKHVGL